MEKSPVNLPDIISDDEMKALESNASPSPSSNLPDTISDEDMAILEGNTDYDKALAEQYALPAKTSATEAFLRSGLQGGSFGFSDEIRGAAQGLYGAATGEGDLSELYKKYRDQERERLELLSEEHPYASFAGELAGAIAVPLPGAAALKGAAAASKYPRLAKAALNIGRGMATGAAYGAGKSKNLESTPGDMAVGGVIGGVIPAGFEAAKAAASVGQNLFLRAPLLHSSGLAKSTEALKEGMEGTLIDPSSGGKATTELLGAFRDQLNKLSNQIDDAMQAGDTDLVKFLNREKEGLLSSMKQFGVTDDILLNIQKKPLQIDTNKLEQVSKLRDAAGQTKNAIEQQIDTVNEKLQHAKEIDSMTKNPLMRIYAQRAAEKAGEEKAAINNLMQQKQALQTQLQKELNTIGPTFQPPQIAKEIDQNDVKKVMNVLNRQNKGGMMGEQEKVIFEQAMRDMGNRSPEMAGKFKRAAEMVRQSNMVEGPLDKAANIIGYGAKKVAESDQTKKIMTGPLGELFDAYTKEDREKQQASARSNPVLDKVNQVNTYTPEQLDQFLGKVAESNPEQMNDVVKVLEAQEKGDTQRKNSLLFSLLQKPSVRKHIEP